MSRTILSRLLLATVSVTAFVPALARAQVAPVAPENSATQADEGEVVVTATRRAEPLQRVPIAVSVIDGETMRAANLNNLRDVASQIPSLNFRTAASNKDQALFLRGIGTVSTSPGVEPSVSTVLDGVVLARQGQATLDLLDIERIEVLRGPQGTLFGKNASAGVLNIVTRKPGDQFHAFLDAAYYTGGDEFRARAGVSGPLAPDVAGSVTVLASRYGGNVTNVFNGATVNGFERYGARAKLAAKLADTLDAVIVADYMHGKDTAPQGVVTRTFRVAFPTNAVTNFPTFATALLPVVAGEQNRQINSNYNTQVEDDNYGISLQLDLGIGTHTLTSITAYRKWKNKQLQDQDRLPTAVAGFPEQHDVGLLDFDQVSQELRIASPKAQFIDYQAGIFVFRGTNSETYRRDTITVAGTARTPNTGIANYGVTNISYAVFGEANIHFAPNFRATAGVRVTHDDLSFRFARTSTSAVPVTGIQTAFTASGSTSAVGYSARTGLQFDAARSVMMYASYARGYKGPAYNPAFSMLAQDTIALKPETSDAFELGLKSRFLRNAVLLNVALFLDKFENYQVPFFDVVNGSQVTRLINAGKVSTRGVEADFTIKPTKAFTISGAVAYTKARIDQFNCPTGTTAACTVNGFPLPFAPEWKGSVRDTYRIPVSSALDIIVGTDVNWQSSTQYSINQTPDTIFGPYGIWNATLGIATVNGLQINLVAKNMTNRSYSPNLATFGSGVVRFVPRDDRRYFGINMHKEF